MYAPFEEFAREHKDLMYALFLVSVLTFLVSLLAVPWLLARIPADYFVRDRPTRLDGERWLVWLLRKVAKNVLGLVLFLAGLAMIGLPGQGLLTMFLGMTLLDFPGKRRLELSLVRRPAVRRAIDWMRAKRGRPPLIVDEDPAAGPDAPPAPAGLDAKPAAHAARAAESVQN